MKKHPPSIPDEEIRPLAERLSKQRPWLSAEENRLAAERALRQKPWRPWLIRFSGEIERSGWDWADLLLKVSVPVLILGLSTAYSLISANRQEKIVREQREGEVVTNFIKEMQPLLVDKGLRSSAPGSEVRGVGRGLTLSALSQVKDSERKRLVVKFLLDSGLKTNPGNLVSLSEANLSEANLSEVDLRGSNLSEADLSKADLRGSNLSEVDLSKADLRGANLRGANLTEVDLSKADLRGSNLREADLRKADLINADLSKADLRDAYLRQANLIDADLSKALLLGSNLSKANLSGASLFEANLNGAILNGTGLSGAYLYEANLVGVKWNERTTWPSPDRVEGAKNIPPALKKQLGL